MHIAYIMQEILYKYTRRENLARLAAPVTPITIRQKQKDPYTTMGYTALI